MEFTLRNIDERTVSLDDFRDRAIIVVVFTCNHCPYAIAYERRLVELQARFAEQGVQFIAINPNDAQKYPEDSFARMQDRHAQRGFNFPYLHDESQDIARAYGAQRTPHVFMLARQADSSLRKVYQGGIDDDYQDARAVKETWLADAIQATLAQPDRPLQETLAVGCSVKWKN
ncbi:MAG: thioredoxin family protein [Bacteroidota bacterium]